MTHALRIALMSVLLSGLVYPTRAAERRPLTATDATAVLERDWLFQAEGQSLKTRALDEIRWARQMLSRLVDRSADVDTKAARAELQDLEATVRPMADTTDGKDLRTLYFAVRELKRRIMLKHPEVDFKQILFVDTPYTRGSEWRHQSRYRSGSMCATTGGRLLVLQGLHPGAAIRQLAPSGEEAAFLRPDLSFDGNKVLFCMKPESDKAYHLYETALTGGRIRQLTFGAYDDVDPIYLPDGHLMFLSARANCFGGCAMWAPQHFLTRCDSDGKNIYIISHSNGEPEYSPSVLPDGRVLYTRWEYNDKWVQRIQSLWTVNPDGTAQGTFWGNQSEWPDHIGEARAMPGSPLVMFTGLGHHNMYSGSIGLIDGRCGLNYPNGLIKVTAELPWGEVGDGPVEPPSASPSYHASGSFGAYKAPYPLSSELFLVSARGGPRNLKHFKDKDEYFRLYLMDIHGNRELIYQGTHNVLYAQPIKVRPHPRILPDRVAWPGNEEEAGPVQQGVLFSADILEGLSTQVRKRARYLRVIENVPRTWSVGVVSAGGSPFGSDRDVALDLPKFLHGEPNASTRGLLGDCIMLGGPATSLTCNTSTRQILGTVPIEQDGSVGFEVPPARSLYFQVVDEHYRTLQTMRSWVSVMPGEKRGCTGCHERHSKAPVTGSRARILTEPVSKLTAPPWGIKSLSYRGDVQPIFDRHCAGCHQGQGEARAGLDLTLRSDPKRRWSGVFPEPYITLVFGDQKPNSRDIPHVAVHDPVRLTLTAVPLQQHLGYETLEPMAGLSVRSKLIDMLLAGHEGVSLDKKDMRTLIAWIDTWCHYRGEEDIRHIEDPDPAWFSDWPYPPRMKTAPVVRREFTQDAYLNQKDRLTRKSPRAGDAR